jgi:hypothetical protein
VLLPLTMNQWNNARLERGEEVVRLERLIADLTIDAASDKRCIRI